jgi:two-component system, NtrC family, response regulator HydG
MAHMLRHDRTAAQSDPFPDVEGGSAEINALKQHMLRVAHDPHVTVLILGESGTGKERVAWAIHRASKRASAPFVVVNCAGLSPTLVEDELFGHMRGAYTGAVEDRPGPFERANGGTVFLDEVGELTSDLQMKLLRALQQRTVQRLGGRHETPFDVRVIAATNADLTLATMRGRFRQDLYYRLKVYELRLPPLRRRGAVNLRRLVDSILAQLSARRQRRRATVDRSVWELFVAYSWPGNVRELENTLERMIVAAGDDLLLTREHLPDDFGAIMRRSSVRGRESPAKVIDFRRALPSQLEVVAAFERNGFACGATAMDLGLSRHQLYRLFKRHGLIVPRGRPPRAEGGRDASSL